MQSPGGPSSATAHSHLGETAVHLPKTKAEVPEGKSSVSGIDDFNATRRDQPVGAIHFAMRFAEFGNNATAF